MEKDERQKYEKIPLKLIKNLGFDIIEVMYGCEALTSINLDNVKEGLLSNLNEKNYTTNTKERYIDTRDATTKFMISKNKRLVNYDLTIDEVKDYFKNYFESHPELLNKPTIADILKLEHIEIEENTHNVLEYGEINIYDLTNKIDDESFEFSPSCGYDIPSLDSDYDDATVDFTVYKDGQKILDCVPEKDVDKFIKKLIEKYR